jgi:hypothetical protein
MVDIILQGADCAEDFDVNPETKAEPGTVMVVNDLGVLEASCQAYDRRVAGIVSGAGDCWPGLILGRKKPASGRVAIALVGRAHCLVDAQYSSVAIGDLLTTSPTPGHAMKATDGTRAFGSVIGKALGTLGSGSGLVPVLVALQ